MGWIVAGALSALLFTGIVVKSRRGQTGSTLSPAALLERISGQNDLLVLDVRTPGEYNSGHIAEAVNIPHTELGGRVDTLQSYRAKDVVVLCERGPRARMAQQILLKAGFLHVYRLEGDMAGWRRNGHPVDSGAAGAE